MIFHQSSLHIDQITENMSGVSKKIKKSSHQRNLDFAVICSVVLRGSVDPYEFYKQNEFSLGTLFLFTLTPMSHVVTSSLTHLKLLLSIIIIIILLNDPYKKLCLPPLVICGGARESEAYVMRIQRETSNRSECTPLQSYRFLG